MDDWKARDLLTQLMRHNQALTRLASYWKKEPVKIIEEGKFICIGVYHPGVGPGLTVVANGVTQDDFEGDYLMVWHRNKDFIIHHVKVGNRIGLPSSSTEVPASPFAIELEDFQKVCKLMAHDKVIERAALDFFNSPTPPLDLGAICIGMHIEIAVTNRGTELMPFAAMIMGRKIKWEARE